MPGAPGQQHRDHDGGQGRKEEAREEETQDQEGKPDGEEKILVPFLALLIDANQGRTVVRGAQQEDQQRKDVESLALPKLRPDHKQGQEQQTVQDTTAHQEIRHRSPEPTITPRAHSRHEGSIPRCGLRVKFGGSRPLWASSRTLGLGVVSSGMRSGVGRSAARTAPQPSNGRGRDGSLATRFPRPGRSKIGRSAAWKAKNVNWRKSRSRSAISTERRPLPTLRVATVRCLTPIHVDGTVDESRPVRFVGETQLMSARGLLPISAPIEASSLEEALEKFPDAINQAVERMVEGSARDPAPRSLADRGTRPGHARSGSEDPSRLNRRG